MWGAVRIKHYITTQVTIRSRIWESAHIVTLFSYFPYFQIRLAHLNLCLKNHPISHFISKIMVIKNDTWLTRKRKLPPLSRLCEPRGSVWFGIFQMRRGRRGMKRPRRDKGSGHINDVPATSPAVWHQNSVGQLCSSPPLVADENL